MGLVGVVETLQTAGRVQKKTIADPPSLLIPARSRVATERE